MLCLDLPRSKKFGDSRRRHHLYSPEGGAAGAMDCFTPQARADAPTQRWTGGASWPWFILRVYATWPLAVLELSGTTLTLRARLGWMAFFGTLSSLHPVGLQNP